MKPIDDSFNHGLLVRDVGHIVDGKMKVTIQEGDSGRYYKDGKWVDFVGPCVIEIDTEQEVPPKGKA